MFRPSNPSTDGRRTDGGATDNLMCAECDKWRGGRGILSFAVYFALSRHVGPGGDIGRRFSVTIPLLFSTN